MKQDTSFKWQSPSIDSLNLASLNVTIVGGTGGLGRAIALVLASKGAQVTVIGRTFRDSEVTNIDFIEADMSSIKVSREVAERLPADNIDILLFTTGIFASKTKQVTPEGLERDLAVSYLNRLAMIEILAPKMKRSKSSLGFGPRIFLMGYPGAGELGTIDDLNQDKNYGLMKAHMNTVAGNEALVLVGAKRYPQLRFFGLNPGLVRTNIRDNMLGQGSWKSYIIEGIIGFFNKTPEQYAKTIVPLLVTGDIEKRSGTSYNANCQAITTSDGMTLAYATSYVEASEELLKTKGL